MSFLSMSSTFNALNNGLNEGAKLEYLEFSVPVILIEDYFKTDKFSNNQSSLSKRYFWKFW